MAEEKAPVKKATVKKTAVKAPEVVEETFVPKEIPLEASNSEGCNCGGGCNCEPKPRSDWHDGKHSHLTLFLVAVFALLFGLMVGSAASMNGGNEHRFHHGFNYSNQYGYDDQYGDQYGDQRLRDGGQVMPLGMMNGQVGSLGTDLGSVQIQGSGQIQVPGQTQYDGSTVTTQP